LIFDASWTADGARHTEGLVVRVKPTRHTIFMESDFESQYKVMKALAERTDVPMPPMKWYEDDPSALGAPFFVMGLVDGRVPADSPPYTISGWMLEDSSPAERRTLVEDGIDVLARIHSLDWRALGFDFLDKTQYGALGLEQQLAYYERAFEWAAAGRPQPVVEAALEWIRANAPSNQGEITLCWGDARINNQIFGPDHRCRAVLDWEMVTLADPMMDLAWWLFLDRHFHEGCAAPRMEGLPTRDEMVARYESKSGRAAHDLEFYEVFAGLRFGVVMIRIAAMVVEFGLAPPESDMGQNNIVTRLLAGMLGLPAPGPTYFNFETS
jgi:aminoglycoside phosphotransferase (APT) family kinase protein